ncbi:MAG TPA: DUF6356 family protein [Micropepsaceae bacterium]
MLQRWFLDHPHSVGESYFEHQRTAFGFSATLFMAAAACLVHGLIPGLLTRTASGKIAQLHERMSIHRRRGERLASGAPDGVNG